MQNINQLSIIIDPATQEAKKQVDAHPKLKIYQTRLQKDLNCFITCFYLAPPGIFKLEENKKNALILVVGKVPVLGLMATPLTIGLSYLNKKIAIIKSIELAICLPTFLI